MANHVSCSGAQLTEEDVVLCSGCSCALDLCISALADAGDNILIPRPGFSLYSTLAVGLGIEVKEYDLIPEKSWEADLDHMDSLVDENTQAIVINNPSNPCGSVFSEQHLKEILTVAEKHCLPIIADEIYDHFVFPGSSYIPIASLTTTVPVLSCGGLTKRFLVPGWRLGWITIHDRNNIFGQEVRDGLKRLSQRIIGANTLVQGALPIILKETPQCFFDNTIKVIQRNAKLAYERLSQIPGLCPVMPSGAMYMMVRIDCCLFPAFRSDLEIVETLIKEQSVFCLPGKCFNIDNFFRIVLTIPERFMHEACDRIEEFCLQHAYLSAEDLMALFKIDEDLAAEKVESGSDEGVGLHGMSSSSSCDSDEQHEKVQQPRKKHSRPAPLLRRETVTRLA